MTSKEFEKADDSTRKAIGKEYGFKRCSYISYKIVGGYFFTLNHLCAPDAFLEVKPMYADDLWWDIFQCPDNKKAPKSMRGNGAFSVSSEKVATYPVFPGSWKQYTEEMIESVWRDVFQRVEQDVESFLAAHPDPDKYFPKPPAPDRDVALLYLLALLHTGALEEAEIMVKEEISKGYSSGMLRDIGGREISGYEYMLDWIHDRMKQD